MGYQASTSQYATTADLSNHMGSAALSAPSISSTALQTAHLVAASGRVDSYLRQRFALPLTQWADDLVQATCRLAAYSLIRVRGYNPDSGADARYAADEEVTIQWLRDVAAGRSTPAVIDSSVGAAVGTSAPEAQPGAYTPSVINSTGGTTRGTGSR